MYNERVTLDDHVQQCVIKFKLQMISTTKAIAVLIQVMW